MRTSPRVRASPKILASAAKRSLQACVLCARLLHNRAAALLCSSPSVTQLTTSLRPDALLPCGAGDNPWAAIPDLSLEAVTPPGSKMQRMCGRAVCASMQAHREHKDLSKASAALTCE